MEKNMPKVAAVLMAAVISAWVGVWVTPAVAKNALVEVTGQTECVNEFGQEIDCAGTGQDGDIQAGVPFPTPRFTDTGNGTVKDNLTHLIWLKNADCFGPQTWRNALNAANSLADDPTSTTTDCGLRDGRVAGDWRLPNVKELRSLFDYGNFNPALPTGHPFLNVQSPFYWSSTMLAGNPDLAWFVLLNVGATIVDVKDATLLVWSVRGGE